MSELFEGWLFVDRDEVLALHSHAIGVYGGRDGAPLTGCVEGSIENAKSAALYLTEDGPVDLLAAATRVLFYLAKNHCFPDGNKRVAWMTFVRIFVMNGFRIEATEEEATILVENVVKDIVDADGVGRWLAEPGRLVAVSP